MLEHHLIDKIMNGLWGHAIYIVALVAFAMLLPAVAWDAASDEFIFIVGGLAVWRYSWALLNWIRFHIFIYLTFPRWRKEADDAGDAALPSHLYLLVTSFRIDAETTRRVYASVVQAAINYGHPVSIIASIVERSDEAFIRQIFDFYNPPEDMSLTFVRIDGTGKRDALACGFRAISKMQPAEDSVAAVIDGDSMLVDDVLAKCATMFGIMPKLAALTTDEFCEVEGRKIFREWYNMRFAQRHIYMSSVSLSRRVLTLTGRMSMFRAPILIRPDFIQQVELDWVDHWRLGRFKFLTGDDKSSWFYLARHGYEMIYVPDVKVVTIETPPLPGFIESSIVLMRRWFGNMLRTNSRAIAQGPSKLNWFPWITVIDQRLSMWTSLTGLAVAIMATFAITPFAVVYYIWWMMFTRYVITISLLAGRERVSVWYPFLLYYNQIVGSLVKTTVLFRLDKQKWTRQNTTLGANTDSFAERMIRFSSLYMHVFALIVFLGLLATLSHIITVPTVSYWNFVLFG